MFTKQGYEISEGALAKVANSANGEGAEIRRILKAKGFRVDPNLRDADIEEYIWNKMPHLAKMRWTI